MTTLSHAPLLLTLSVLLTLTGCFSQRPDLDFGEVQGTVTYEGQPLPNATVKFQPQEGRPSYGKTDDSGHYSLLFMGEDWGAIVGDHEVAITTEDRIENRETGESSWQKEILPRKYHAQTELTATVEPGENEINFDLTK